jgi:sugar/nucleoside kinase (ribokinase family)
MGDALIDVTGIGNAIVDVLAKASDESLASLGLHKGTMALVDRERADVLYGGMGQGVEMSGGSAANSMAGIASLGGRAAYIGKVADDQLGEVFSHDIRAVGVRFETAKVPGGDTSTARCLIMVTPDAQRTMSTFLGACLQLGPDDIDERLIADSKVVYLEGYLWDPPAAKEAFLKAARVARRAGRKVALSLSDPFCVERHRNELRELVHEHVDILFANEREACALYQVEQVEQAVEELRGRCELAAVTLSARGSLVLAGEQAIPVPAARVERVVDTTGAGDLYAAGFLHGYCTGRPPELCARLGSLCAAEVIAHFGARPEISLRKLAAQLLDS